MLLTKCTQLKNINNIPEKIGKKIEAMQIASICNQIISTYFIRGLVDNSPAGIGNISICPGLGSAASNG